jgi:CheY-like chemotaxis protein
MSDAPACEDEREECILVVDDEEGIRETLVEVIEMIGCQAISAQDGAEALKMLAQRRPCLVILDLLMPVMTGVELLEAMRKDPALATIPVLISTSAPHRAPAGVPVLTKPFDIESIWGWIRRSCRCASRMPSTPAPHRG